ncbi:Coenzyme F420 hydrogenase/dehydrogenase, beta subunit C-terminal domain [Candidatus Thiodictyon syntrophicum]|jgi:coenzyme F420 hydrogenase subunit beta|uniref:Coenzyme F420 hydrogenase n=1 Tax=Candidatus Thiodictyon syntrophicum TaxID=1166950 RepID=A0A2K8UKA0_9GAMM|nr:Coenzyme F420 hydrogenase/dehydrogenase, beta subunit C-terminal domain [Candidatus Thiodictyon syntrophicum]AUB85581.1 coenzyme F420 hydrogenase [Candidatus Thiodictyon syntrophicum]
MEQGPSKGLHDVSLMSHDRRLAGRPRLCSDCGLCDSWLRPQMADTCLFVRNRMEEIESRLHGRRRHPGDEMRFGIYREQAILRMRRPVAGAQWTGMVTTLAARLLERGEVEAVILTGTNPGTRFEPLPVLARTPEEVRACVGNKPSLSPNLGLLDQVRESGIRRLAVIGTGCQVQVLRQAQDQLGLERLDVIGIPCSDNVTYADQQFFLDTISSSPRTVVHYEFMQDFSLWLHHEDGHRERVNYIDFPMDKLQGIFPSACLSCFDYPNALADLTIGYMGAPLGWQWVLARTARGVELLDLLRPDLESRPLSEAGDRTRGMPRFIAMLAKRPGKPPKLIRQLIAFLQRRRGPRGLEFARAIIEMKLLRNYTYVRDKFPQMEEKIVPYHVYEATRPYAAEYAATFGRAPGEGLEQA